MGQIVGVLWLRFVFTWVQKQGLFQKMMLSSFLGMCVLTRIGDEFGW